jgi:hypothetical protein
LVKEIVDAADITHIHDEWTRMKFDERKYRSTEMYGSPRDPALIKEYEDFLRQKLGPERYAEYQKSRSQAGAAGRGATGRGAAGRGAPGRGGPPQ